MSDQFKRRRRRSGTGYRNVKLIPVEQAQGLPIGRPELAACGAVVLVVMALVALIWIVAHRAVQDARSDLRYRTEQMLSGEAATIAETVRHELLVIDQSLKVIQTAWKNDSDSVDLAKWKEDMPSLMSVADDLFISDDRHIIRQDILPNAIGQSIGSAYVSFPHGSLETYQSDGSQDREALLLKGEVGPPIDARQFMMYIVRPLDHPKGWLVGASYRSEELTRLFAKAGLGIDPIAALVELRHGVVQAVVGPAARRPKVDFSSSPMFALMSRSDNGVWDGETSIDGVTRLHAFSRVQGRDIVVVVGASTREMMAPADNIAAGTYALATAGSVLVAAFGALILWELYTLRGYRRRQRILERNRQELDRLRAGDIANVARAAVNAARLQVVLQSIQDGVALFDSSQRLVQWNHPFLRGIGIPLRADMPLDALLREQISAGLFGDIHPVEPEVARRLSVLRAGAQHGLPQLGPDGETLMLRGLTADEGGFMLLLSGLERWEAPPPPAPAEAAEEKPVDTPAPAPIEW
jgi:PAS domain-containing protein